MSLSSGLPPPGAVVTATLRLVLPVQSFPFELTQRQQMSCLLVNITSHCSFETSLPGLTRLQTLCEKKAKQLTHFSNPLLLLKGKLGYVPTSLEVFVLIRSFPLHHTPSLIFLKCELFLNDTTCLVCVNSVFLLFIFKFMSVVKQKCLILSKQTLPFNRNEFHPQVYCILAAIYCLGTVSNCNGKLCGWPC